MRSLYYLAEKSMGRLVGWSEEGLAATAVQVLEEEEPACGLYRADLVPQRQHRWRTDDNRKSAKSLGEN